MLLTACEEAKVFSAHGDLLIRRGEEGNRKEVLPEKVQK